MSSLLDKMIDDAVHEDVRMGFNNALAEACSGRDDPEDRCPMNPKDGCSCVWSEWERRPWWRKVFRAAPKMPTAEAALAGFIGDIVAHGGREARDE